jgi:hypothetical protein
VRVLVKRDDADSVLGELWRSGLVCQVAIRWTGGSRTKLVRSSSRSQLAFELHHCGRAV